MFDADSFFDAKRVVDQHTVKTDAKGIDHERYHDKSVSSDFFPVPETQNTQTIPLFVTPLLTTNLHSKYIDMMGTVVQQESENRQENVKIHSGRGCYQSDEDLHIRHENVKILVDLVEKIVKENFNLDVEVKDCWLNVNHPGGYNYEHTHDGIIAGCFYLQVPQQSGNIIFHNPAVRAEHLPMIYQYNERYMVVTPEEGDLILFPSWLTHHVEPNLSQDNRISISFNAFLKT